MASRTTARASSATKSWSRTPNTSSGSSGYDYDAAERARLEALRRKIIEDNNSGRTGKSKWLYKNVYYDNAKLVRALIRDYIA